MGMDINSPIALIIEPHIQIPSPHTETHTPPPTGVFLILMHIRCPSSIHAHAPTRPSILSYWIVVARNNFSAACLNQVGGHKPAGSQPHDDAASPGYGRGTSG